MGNIICCEENRIRKNKHNVNKQKNEDNENKGNKDTITRSEFNQIVNSLINENNQIRYENEKLRIQLSQFQDLFQNNLNKNGFNLQQNNQMMLNVGGANRNINNIDNITFALPDGNQYIIFLNNITKTSEALEELKIQRKDLPDIEHLQFIYNANNITKYFTTDFEIRALNLCQPILVMINKN